MNKDEDTSGTKKAPTEEQAEAAAKTATNEAERHKTGELPGKAAKNK